MAKGLVCSYISCFSVILLDCGIILCFDNVVPIISRFFFSPVDKQGNRPLLGSARVGVYRQRGAIPGSLLPSENSITIPLVANVGHL